MAQIKEIWKKVNNYPNYEISSLGNLRRNGKLLKPGYRPSGKYKFTLSKNNITKQITRYRLVAEAFIPNPYNKETVNHIDGNKSNDCVDNLEWATLSENIQHCWDIGLKNYDGINNPNYKTGKHLGKSKR